MPYGNPCPNCGKGNLDPWETEKDCPCCANAPPEEKREPIVFLKTPPGAA